MKFIYNPIINKYSAFLEEPQLVAKNSWDGKYLWKIGRFVNEEGNMPTDYPVEKLSAYDLIILSSSAEVPIVNPYGLYGTFGDMTKVDDLRGWTFLI